MPIAQGQGLLAGQRVLGGERDQHRILEQQPHTQPRPVPFALARKLEQQREVEIAGA